MDQAHSLGPRRVYATRAKSIRRIERIDKVSHQSESKVDEGWVSEGGEGNYQHIGALGRTGMHLVKLVIFVVITWFAKKFKSALWHFRHHELAV